MTTVTERRSITPESVQRWTMAIAGAATLMGAWAFAFPRGFFDDFPVQGAQWVSTLGEFNDHLLRDFGSAQVGLGVAGMVAARTGALEAIRSILIGFVAFGALHLSFHLTTLGEFTAASWASQIVALVTFVAIPLGLLGSIERRRAA